MNIYRRYESHVWQYRIENESPWIGASQATLGSFFHCMTVWSNRENSLCLKKENFFLQLLEAIPVIGWFVSVPFSIYENSTCIGGSKGKCNSSTYIFYVKDDVYELSLHKQDKVSLLKNGKQVALYQRIVSGGIEGKAAYSVLHILDVEKKILLLFSMFIDQIYFFTGNYQWKKAIPLGDKHPERVNWEPTENEK